MKLKNQQQFWITPLIETMVFEKTLLPPAPSAHWVRQISSRHPTISEADLSVRSQQILAQSRHTQAQLQQLTQRYYL